MKNSNVKEILNGYVENLTTAAVVASEDVEKNNGKGEYSKLDLFDVNGIKDFYETIIRLEQWDDSFDGNFCFKRRLVKVNKYLDVITKEQHKDSLFPHVIRGLFLELEVCFIPRKFIETGRARKGIYSVNILVPPKDPKSLGLPGSDEVLWGTVREISNDMCVAISCRGNQAWMKDWITRASSWEYVRVC